MNISFNGISRKGFFQLQISFKAFYVGLPLHVLRVSKVVEKSDNDLILKKFF
jgi:hypothetical protein